MDGNNQSLLMINKDIAYNCWCSNMQSGCMEIKIELKYLN